MFARKRKQYFILICFALFLVPDPVNDSDYTEQMKGCFLVE